MGINYIAPPELDSLIDTSKNPKQEDFNGLFYTDEIDFDRLARDLRAYLPFNSFMFDWKKYVSNTTRRVFFTDPEGPTIESKEKIVNPFTYRNTNQSIQSAYFEGSKLNQYIGKLSGELIYSVYFDGENIVYKISFPYANTEQFEVPINDTTNNPYDFAINDKYRAVTLTTKNFDDFLEFIKYIKGKNYLPGLNYLGSTFARIIKNADNNEQQLKLIYEQIPMFIFYDNGPFNILEVIDRKEDELWNDFLTISTQSDSGLALFKLMSASGAYFFYKQLYENPLILKSVYENLSSSKIQLSENEAISHKQIFCSALIGICQSAYGNKTLKCKATKVDFFIGKDYKIDANILFKDDKEKEDDPENKAKNTYKIFLQQKTLKTKQVTRLAVPGMPSAGFINTTESTFQPENEGYYFEPLDLVSLKNFDNPLDTGAMVPAIYLQCLAEEAEWNNIKEAVMLSFHIAVIIISTVSLAGGAVGLVLLADGVAIVTSGIDLALMTVIENCPEKAEFIKYWEPISAVVNGVVCTPLLAKSILTNAPKLYGLALRTGTYTSEAVVFLGKAIGSAVRAAFRIPHIVQETIIFFKTAAELIVIDRRFITLIASLKRMYNEGVIFIKADVKNGDRMKGIFFARYKDKIIAHGTYEEIRATLKDAIKADSRALPRILDDLDDLTWKLFDRMLASGNTYEKTRTLERIYTEGSLVDFEKGVKYLTEVERKEYEVFVQGDRIIDAKGNALDTKGSIEIDINGKPNPSNKAIFVMSEKCNIYISKLNEIGKFHHSSFLSGEKVAAAGDIVIENGVIKQITNNSGHYKPILDNVRKNILNELKFRDYFTNQGLIGNEIEESIKFTNY